MRYNRIRSWAAQAARVGLIQSIVATAAWAAGPNSNSPEAPFAVGPLACNQTATLGKFPTEDRETYPRQMVIGFDVKPAWACHRYGLLEIKAFP